VERIRHAIAGKAHGEGQPARQLPVYNPATGQQTAWVDAATRTEVDAAVNAAKDAWPAWRDTSLAQKTQVLFALRHLLVERRTELARVITAEHGKVLADAVGEVNRGIENVEFACGIPQLLKGGHSAEVATGVDVHELRQPLGVVVGITPFNFPAMVPLWMLGSALACGNAFILKPSERDPSASLILADILAEAGVPAGVFDVVHGDREAVEALIDHPDVQAVSFVGSTAVARQIYARAATNGKRAQALGSAKNHMVVLPDADLGAAADAAVSAAYGSAGERCMAVSVVVAVGGVGDALAKEIIDRAEALKVGAGDDPGSEMGPLVTQQHRERVVSYIEAGQHEGAAITLDGRTKGKAKTDGFFVGPTVLDRVTPDMRVYKEEIFGPVLSIVRVDTYDEALKLVNEHEFGNGAAIFTADGGIARRFAHEAQVGMIGVNVPIPVPVSSYSFGGWKSSLFGDSHIYGPESIHFYTRTKVVTTRWPERASGVDLAFPQNR
jgi:malonate-semialdehyde dehydrogenase (acetylating)/methylmalonate-semialdehyde dehydrogenase